ncbi:MAG: OmpA family protein, partial [Thermomicrobiales bacterium]
MIRTFANGLADLLMGQVPSLEQAEIDFANAYPHGLIFRPDRKYRLPGQNELDDRLILFNFGVGDASIDRFLLDTGQILGVQGTALFQAVDTLPGETYASLNQVRPLIEEWISLGDDIEIGGAASFTGSEKRNFELSEERGGMVVQWMVDELGADPDKIRLRWIGAAWPRFDNDATLLFTHRRVEITRFRTEWEMGEFDRVIPELEDTPQDRRIEQLIAHLQHDKDDVCIV